ncbi:MAG: cobalt transporter CbiM [Thermoguttaceae bacterium]|jgi:cobalt/nickel transport system permease protein
MHIYEGFLSATASGREVLLVGSLAAAAGTAIGLRRLDYERIPKTAVLSAAFFVVSMIQVPLGPSSVHLVLGGLLGLVLGWSAFPAVLVALVLQAAFFAPTGLTTLGLNTLIMALPAVACHYLFRKGVQSGRVWLVFIAGFAAGVTAILLGVVLSVGAIALAGKDFHAAARLLFAWYLPLAPVEGLVTANVVVLLRKVRPEVLQLLPTTAALRELANG